MKSTFLNSIKDAVKYWYILLLVGLFFITVSIIVFTSPSNSLVALSILFALSFLFGGLSEIAFALVNSKRLDNWGWSLAFGIITAIVGIQLLIHPTLSLNVLAFYIGFIMLFRSIGAISFALDIKKYGSRNWGGLLVLGIIGAVFSFILIWNPVFAGLSIVLLTAITFLTTGVFSILFSLVIRKIHLSTKDISEKLRERYEELMEDIREEWEDD